ncbi:MAG: guanylate kinase [Candidatus Omnitrophota bacterium]
MTRKPTIFILSGPSGAGKTTLVNELFGKEQIQKYFVRGISVTTRPKRPQEQQGKDYFFVSKPVFLKLKSKKFFLESQRVLNNYYGTPRYFYTDAAKGKKDLILCIDVKGGMYLKKQRNLGKIITLFISAPTEGDLCQRLEKRVEKKETIAKRIELAKKELQFAKYYDALIINKDIHASLRKLENILLAEKQS